MSQQVITTPAPSISFWRRRSFVAAALVTLLAAGAGAAIGVLVSSDSSITYRSAPAAIPAGDCIGDGTSDGIYLADVSVSLPDGTGAAMVAGLSPQVQRRVAEASFTRWETPTMPDVAVIAGVLTRLGSADRDVVFSALPAQVQADVGATLNNVAFFSPCP